MQTERFLLLGFLSEPFEKPFLPLRFLSVRLKKDSCRPVEFRLPSSIGVSDYKWYVPLNEVIFFERTKLEGREVIEVFMLPRSVNNSFQTNSKDILKFLQVNYIPNIEQVSNTRIVHV